MLSQSKRLILDSNIKQVDSALLALKGICILNDHDALNVEANIDLANEYLKEALKILKAKRS